MSDWDKRFEEFGPLYEKYQARQGSFECAARKSNMGPSPPQECDWPFCGCDPHANKVMATLEECGLEMPSSARKAVFGDIFLRGEEGWGFMWSPVSDDGFAYAWRWIRGEGIL